MYKFTVFTVIFSVIVVFVVINLIFTDFRTTNKSFNENIVETTPTPSSQTAIPFENFEDNKIKVEIEPKVNDQKTDEDSFLINSEISRDQIIARDFSEPIFSIFDPVNIGTLKVKKFYIKDGNLSGVEAYKIVNVDEISATRQYNLFSNDASNSARFSINANDSFGQRSFYLNDESNPDFVFLIILSRNVIYAFAYPKEKHELMISIYNNLQ